jgi:DNA-binding MarR family transcriptional regulator
MSEAASLAEDLLTTVARLNRAVNRRSRLPLAPALARFLAQLDDLGALRISELAQADGCSQPTASTAVAKLEAQGLVERRSDPQDARASVIDLTQRGRAALAETRAARVAALAPTIEALPEPEREQLTSGLLAVRRLLDLGP